nr:MAG TPA: hypothetical protein [Caudoviricetes sp.]
MEIFRKTKHLSETSRFKPLSHVGWMKYPRHER